MSTFEEAVSAYQGTLSTKQNKIEWQPAMLGDGHGTVSTGNNMCLVRLSDNSAVVEVLNLRTEMRDGMRVRISKTPEMPLVWQVISQDDQRIDENGNGGGGGNYSIPLHHLSHEYLKSDQVNIDWRQITALRVYVSSAFTIGILAGLLPRPGADLVVATQTLDLTSHIPVGAAYALISVNSVGTIVATDGTPVSGVSLLTLADIPDTPAGNFRLAAVRLYTGQAALSESTSANDIRDLRWPQEKLASSIGVSDITLTTNHIIVGASGVGSDVAMSGDATIVASGALTLNTVNTVTPGTFGAATKSAVITVNGKGLVTASAEVTITVPVGANPTASSTGAAINGVATTFMRSDAAFAIASLPDEKILRDLTGSPALTTLHDDWRTTGSSGVADGTLTYVSVGSTAVKISVAAGDGYIRASNDQQAELTICHWAASADIYTFSVPAAGQETAIFVGIEMSGGSAVAVTSATFSYFNGYDKFWLARVSYDGTTMRILNTYAHAEDVANNTRLWLRLTHPFVREEAPEGSGGLEVSSLLRALAMTAGNVWHGYNRYVLSALSSGVAFDTHYKKAGGGFNSTIGVTAWPNTQYDDTSGIRQDLTANRYGTLWVYVDVSDGSLDVMYGAVNATSVANAQLDTVPTTPNHLTYHGKLIGRIIFRNGGASATLVESAWTSAFSASSVGDHALLTNLLGTSPYYHLPTPVAPAAALMNVAGIVNAETDWSNKPLFDGTAASDLAGTAAAGTSLLASHRDHVHLGLTSAQLTDLTDGGATTLHSHAGGGDISGTGVVGQVAEFVTDTKTIQAAKIIGPATNILTLTNAAASTLALAITSAKTLTLTAVDNFTLTIAAAASISGTNTGDNSANTTIQIAYASGGAAPAGGTGATAGAYDTEVHRDALITLVNNMRTALINNGIMS